MDRRHAHRKGAFPTLAATVGLLALVAVPVGAAGNGNGHGKGNGKVHAKGTATKSNNRLLAAGTATEVVGADHWKITFQIHARNNGQSSKVAVQTPTASFTYVGSVCSGWYATPTGPTVYVVGRQTSYTGTTFQAPYYGYSIHRGGPLGADSSWVSSFATPAAAQAVCANPAALLPTPFALSAADVRFKV